MFKFLLLDENINSTQFNDFAESIRVDLIAFIFNHLPNVDEAVQQKIASTKDYVCPITLEDAGEINFLVYVYSGSSVYSLDALLKAWISNSKNPMTNLPLSLKELHKVSLQKTR